MNQIIFILADYLKGKSIYPPFRRALNFLFSFSISSFAYEHFYGEYDWLNYNDYKGILDFFIRGEFFIPFSIFIVVYGGTQFISYATFYGINHMKTVKLTRKIIAYQIKNETVDEHLKNITKVSKVLTPKRITKSYLKELYDELKGEISEEAYRDLENELVEPKKIIERNFHLVFRAIIAITVYFIVLPNFGGKLYAMVTILLISALYLLLISHRILGVLPTLARKLNTIAESYLIKRIEEEKNNIE